MYSITSDAKKYLNEINHRTDNVSENSSSTEKAKPVKTQAKTKNVNELKEGWRYKPLHGKYLVLTSDPDVNSSLSHQWLALSYLESETEGFIIAVQDQSLITRSFQENILKNGADPKYRVCDRQTEIIDHPVSGCPMVTPTEYLNRYDYQDSTSTGVCVKNFVLPDESSWWEHKLPKVIGNKNTTISWDFGIHTDKTIQANRPDIIVKNHNDKTCFFIATSVPSGTNYHSEYLKN